MDLANIIALVSSAHIDPSTAPEINVEPEVTETVIGRNLPSKKQAKAEAAAKGEVKAPIHAKPAVFGVAMPERNTLDAKGFLLACRDAGKRSFESVDQATGEVRRVIKVDQTKVRDDLICAIHAYCGYDNRRDFGSQDAEARAKAQRELRGGVVPGPTREEKRSAERSMTGFVKGMPAPQQRMVRDLQARAVSLAESRDKAATALERGQFQVLLDSTNAALKELGF